MSLPLDCPSRGFESRPGASPQCSRLHCEYCTNNVIKPYRHRWAVKKNIVRFNNSLCNVHCTVHCTVYCIIHLEVRGLHYFVMRFYSTTQYSLYRPSGPMGIRTRDRWSSVCWFSNKPTHLHIFQMYIVIVHVQLYSTYRD